MKKTNRTMVQWWRYAFVIMCLAVYSNVGNAQSYHVEIPYKDLRGKIIIPAKVGNYNGNFILDTGSEVTLITSELANKLDNTKTDVSYAKDATGRKSSFDKMIVPSVSLGPNELLKFNELSALILEAGSPFECYGVDGIIGNDILKHSVLRIDSRKKIVILTNSIDSFSILSRNRKEILHKRLPLIQVGLNRIEMDDVVFDSGSNGFYELCSASYNKIGFDDVMSVIDTGFGASYMGVGGIEDKSHKTRLQIPYLTIGTGKFLNVRTITTTARRSRLGTKILEYGIVTIDYPNELFYYESFNQSPVEVDDKIWNAGISVSDTNLVIGVVWSSIKDQLKGGEQVITINGQDVSVIDPCKAITSKIVQMEGDKANITIKDAEGNIKEIVLLKE